jgi:hypothetical protein
MLDFAVSSDLSALAKGKVQATEISTPKGKVKGTLKNVDGMTYQLAVPAKNASVVATWLRDLSDGYTSFNVDGAKDFSARRMPGPFVVEEIKKKAETRKAEEGRGEDNLGLWGQAPRPRKRRCRRSCGMNPKVS